MSFQKSKHKYPVDWPLISAKIKFERAENCCEICLAKNGSLIHRLKRGNWCAPSEGEMHNYHYHKGKFKATEMTAAKKAGLQRIVLTVAHKDHCESNCTPENLICLCLSCHVKMDRVDNRIRAAKAKQALCKPYPLFNE